MTTTSEMFLLCIGTSSIGSLLFGASEKTKQQNRQYRELLYPLVNGAQPWYFELFWPHTKLSLNGRKPQNNSSIR